MSVPADPKVFEKRERVPVSGGVTVITIEPEKGSNAYRCPICAPPQCAFSGSRSDPAMSRGECLWGAAQQGRMKGVDVLGSRILLRPSEPGRSRRFYRDTL